MVRQLHDKVLDLFADFNGMPQGADKTEFYQHDQNWSNRMILGDSLSLMASLAEREGLRGKDRGFTFLVATTDFTNHLLNPNLAAS